jgi:major membrane immunogen (membrane-anchored lipoprotein)
MKRILIAVLAGSLLLVAGCGEKQSVIVYKQGQYQGKPDTQPWDNAAFKNDHAAWEKAIKARNGSQNEYARIAN